MNSKGYYIATPCTFVLLDVWDGKMDVLDGKMENEDSEKWTIGKKKKERNAGSIINSFSKFI